MLDDDFPLSSRRELLSPLEPLPQPQADQTQQQSSEKQDNKERGEWRAYSSRNQPGPRSAHQIVASPANGGLLWLFGGEFASSRMTSFHHYRDLWVFSVAQKAWERIDTKVKPR
jgi:Galactose oxidase, central domain